LADHPGVIEEPPTLHCLSGLPGLETLCYLAQHRGGMRRGWFDRGGTGGAKDSMRTISFRHRLPALPTALALAAGVIGCGSEKGPTEPAIPPVASVQVTPAFDTLTALGQTHQLAAVAKDASGAPISG